MIINIENNQKVVYVSREDINVLKHLNYKISSSIMEAIKKNKNNNFLKIENEKDVLFFESLDWILNYKEIKNYSKKQLEEKINAIFLEKRRTVNQEERWLLSYQFKALSEFLLYKKGTFNYRLPLVPDSNGICLNDDEMNYEFYASLNPNILLLAKKNKMPFKRGDVLPEAFIESCLSKVIMNKNELREFLGDFEIDRYLSSDGKFVVFEFKNLDKDYPKEEKPKGIKRVLAKVIPNKKLP